MASRGSRNSRADLEEEASDPTAGMPWRRYVAKLDTMINWRRHRKTRMPRISKT